MGSLAARSSALRVVSLLPSATENVCALLSKCRSTFPSPPSVPQLVGRSHECDFPSDGSVQRLPALTSARTAFTSSADTHNQVRAALASAASLYHLDADRLAALKPDVILTQSSCKVCSIDLASVQAAVDGEQLQELVQVNGSLAPCDTRGGSHLTQIVTCNPTSLEDALVTQFQQLGDALGVPEVGNVMAREHADELQQLKRQAEGFVEANEGRKPRVLMVEWLEPLFLGTKGWMREIVEAAGGQVVESLEEGVDVVVVALCGLTLDKTEKELLEGRVGSWWTALVSGAAVPPVYIVDGTSMFTRPTRRLLVALEWLVHALHELDSSWMKSSPFPYKTFDTSLVECDPEAAEETKTPEMLEIEELHRAACANKQAMYTDPATGYSVMTAYILKERQVCCGNGCRHCPYGHANVKDPARRKNTLAGNVFLQPRRRSRGVAKDAPGGRLLWPEGAAAAVADSPNDLVVVFWSGGKDSFLALSALYETYAAEQKPMPRVVLLTTIDPETNVVPIQNISAQTIAAQAEALELPLCLVAVGLGDAYTSALRSALADIPGQIKRVKKSNKTREQTKETPIVSSLVFGDLHLEDIRAWREQTFGRDYKLRFPVWKKDYEAELLPALTRLCTKTGAKIYFSNVDEERLASSRSNGAEWQVGQEYDWKRVQERNKAVAGDAEQVDLMGECGEFHTCVKFPGME
ncbi:hypothetical protein PRIC1_012089 [Phytophthora ramorum]